MLGRWEGTQGGLSIKTIWKFAWERKMTSHIQLTNLARVVSGCLLMGPPQSLCQSLCFGLIIEPTSIFFILSSPGLSRYMVQKGWSGERRKSWQSLPGHRRTVPISCHKSPLPHNSTPERNSRQLPLGMSARHLL